MNKMVVAITALCMFAPAVFAAGSVRDACGNDVKTLCGDVQPGGGRIKTCMREHRQQLSAECKAALVTQRRAHRNGGGQPNDPPSDSGNVQ